MYSTNRKHGVATNFSNTLGYLIMPKLSNTERGECEGILKESQLLAALKTTKQNKSLGEWWIAIRILQSILERHKN